MELRIGQAARRGGVSVQTLRFYERRGLLLPEARRESGYRIYADDAIRKIRFIKNAQRLGFSLAEIAGLLKLRSIHGAHCRGVRTKAKSKLNDVRKQVAILRALERVLSGLVSSCHDRSGNEPCPVIKELEADRPHGGKLRGRGK